MMHCSVKKLFVMIAVCMALIGALGLYTGLAENKLPASAGTEALQSATHPAAPAGMPAQSQTQAEAVKPAADRHDQISFTNGLISIAKKTGFYAFMTGTGWKSLIMIIIGGILIYLGVFKDFEPLLLLPIAFGTIFVNVTGAGMGEGPHGLLYLIFKYGLENEVLPLLVFIGIGALADFGPMLANPRVAILGAAAQFGVFGTLLGVMVLNLVPGFDYSIKEACAIAIIGGADGPTSIYVSSLFAPHLMGAIAVAAYSYMAMVPIIQPPIMRLLTTKEERLIRMRQTREVHKLEKLFFPIVVLALCVFILPSALPLMGCFAFGNFAKESGVIDRLSKTMGNELMNLATIFLGLGVGMQMLADQFLNIQTLGILLLGLLAFSFGTAGGVVFAKIMNKLSPKNPINPLIGSAGVSAFPMAARVSNRLGLQYDPHNFLLSHAMGANVAGQIGSVVAAGVILAIFGF
jgi:sodium ion-translocating decarboxylase beta subunit